MKNIAKVESRNAEQKEGSAVANEPKESRITIGTGIIITLVAGIIAGGGTTLLNHERRISTVEANQVAINATLSSMNSTVCEIRNDLKEHQKMTLELREGKRQ
jgi:uncharacterized protein (DUF39 family)